MSQANTHTDPPIVYEARGLTKYFPVRKGLLNRVSGHVRAVDGVDLTIRQGEILGEPPRHRLAVDQMGGLAAAELRPVGNIGRAADLRLVAADEVPVPGGHQVRLDEVGALVDRPLIAGQRMFGPFAAGTAMGDHWVLREVEHNG